MPKKQTILVFAPHPDDDVLGCGGTLIKWARQGKSITVVYLTSGEAGSIHFSKEELLEKREEEAHRAIRIMGINDCIFLHQPDGGIEVCTEVLDAVVELLRQKRPEVVFLPHREDVHRDHLKTHELVVEACRRAAGPWHQQCASSSWEVNWILAYEVWAPLREIHLVEDISEFMKIKINALREHQSQLSDIAYDEAISGLNRYRGITSGRGQYCECFQIIKARMDFQG